MAGAKKTRYPIIYVRGYAMTQSEIVETTSTPYMGFEAGSTKIRQQWDRSVKRLFFESPIVRLRSLTAPRESRGYTSPHVGADLPHADHEDPDRVSLRGGLVRDQGRAAASRGRCAAGRSAGSCSPRAVASLSASAAFPWRAAARTPARGRAPGSRCDGEA